MRNPGTLMIRSILLAASAALFIFAAHAGTLGNMAQGLLKNYGQTSSNNQSAPGRQEIADGIRQALAKGTQQAVRQLGRRGGFWGNPKFQIPLPGPVARLQSVLDRAGAGDQLDQLHASINRAAEQAVPLAADVFSAAVRNLTLNDVRGILNGPQDAATQYFRRTTSGELTRKFEPVVAGVTGKIGLVRQYDQVMSRAGPLAAMTGTDVNLNDYVTKQALDALFTKVADEEKAIRTDPAARTTDLLRQVFGQGG